MRRRGALVAGLALLAGLALGGCGGIQLDASPIAMPTGPLPPILRASQNSQPSKPQTATSAPCLGRCITVYFTSGQSNLLVGNVRYLKKPLGTMTLQQGLQAALNELVQGPTASEGSAGESTFLSFPKPLPVLTVLGVRSGVALVELDEVTTQTGIYQYEEALGQIVWTLAGTTYFPTVHAVAFQYGGASWPAILPNGPNGELASGAVTRQDFRAIAPAAS